jgi:hypothetical protein
MNEPCVTVYVYNFTEGKKKLKTKINALVS